MLRRVSLIVFPVLALSCRNEFVKAQFELSAAESGALRQGLGDNDGGVDSTNADGGLAECGPLATRCTPTNLSGRIYSGGAMWGELGQEAQNVTLIGATEAVILDPSQGVGGSLTFSLIDATRISSSYWAPPPSADVKGISRMEFNYDFLDATFRLAAGSSLAGDYVVRTVFVTEATASDVTGTMKRGDKLLRKASETSFRWCNATACASDREQVATGLIQESKLKNYLFPGQGNPNYIPWAVPLNNEFNISAEALNRPNQLWAIEFDMTNAIALRTPASQLETEPQLLDAFELSSPKDQEGMGPDDTEISVTLRLAPAP